MTQEAQRANKARDADDAGLLSDKQDLENYIPYLLNRLAYRWNLDQSRDLGDYGVSGTVLRALSSLHIFTTLTVNEIATYAAVDQSNASRAIDTMVSSGLVERQIAESDLRRREVVLTDKGRELLKTLWPMMMSNRDRFIANIPEKNLRICADTLRAMLRNAEGGEI